MRVQFVLSLILITVAANAVSRQAQVNKAIEQTKSRQTAVQAAVRVSNRSQKSPGRNEVIDVDRLNRLIRAVDKTWILPKAGAKEPIGSNFQYKKTCASIFKARHGACQQLGFGVMCFNYCHERGEKLSFRCQDASDATYCRQSSTFETFLAKYRRDGYKAKAYIHQMISRCFATSICNVQNGLLNSTIIEDEEIIEKTTKINRLRLLTRSSKASQKTTTVIPLESEDEDGREELSTTIKRKVSAKKHTSLKVKATTIPTSNTTTEKNNIWDKFTVGQKSKPSSKYIPFWQRLLSTTASTRSEEDTESEILFEKDARSEIPNIEEINKKVDTEDTMEESTASSKENQVASESKKLNLTNNSQHKTGENAEKIEKQRHTFKPLLITTPFPPGPELLAYQKRGESSNEAGTGFWNRFQPNRWFQSIHYVTNTGRK